jgi:translocation protein SEC63
MSGFRDTFTKDDKQDEALSYDDTAFYYFASSVIVVFLVPWTYTVVRNLLFGEPESKAEVPGARKAGSTVTYCKSSEMVEQERMARKQEAAAKGGSPLVRYGLLALLWIVFLYCVTQVSGAATEIKKFDPFDILEVSTSANDKEIKKAYRKLSLVYHPDKNPDDPLASARFIQITKAYASLTDPVAKTNYEKYGNPDGPTTTKVGIGLPRFLLEKDNQLMILCLFFFFLLFVVPMVFIMYYQRTKNYAPNGVMLETLYLCGRFINEASRLKNCPELLAASAESRSMLTRPTDNSEMINLGKEVVEHKALTIKPPLPIVRKNSFLIWGHMQRLHHLMSADLRKDNDELLKHSMKITQAMIEIACSWEWFFTAQAMIEFRRSLVQGLDWKASQLLQVPHFNQETLKHCTRGKSPVHNLAEFLAQDPADRKGLNDMSDQQLLDVEAFAKHVSNMELKALVEVEDEGEIVVGDVATVQIQLTRKQLREGEAVGPVHAPLFPEPKYEEWWLFLIENTAANNPRIICFKRVRDCEKVVHEKLQFQVSRPGKHSLCLHALCDSYTGIDQKIDLNFNAQQEDEVKREIFVHPEDEDLDNQPTLFQQFMGELNQEEDSEEEEEGEAKGAGNAATGKKAGADDGAKKGKGKAKKDDSDSESSSDSD